MITFDKKTLEQWHSDGIDSVSIYFSQSGCAGTKIKVETEQSPLCDYCIVENGLNIYVKKQELKDIEGGKITHVGNKWIFTNENINSRCGCGSSFSLKSENPLHDKIARMKLAMKQKKEGSHR